MTINEACELLRPGTSEECIRQMKNDNIPYGQIIARINEAIEVVCDAAQKYQLCHKEKTLA